MKSKIIKSGIVLFALLFFLFVGCKNDISTLDLNKLPEVSVDTTNQSTLSVFQFDDLVLEPKIIDKEGIDQHLSFEWFINLEPFSAEYVSIGKEKKLTYNVRVIPTRSGYPYQIVLKIYDNKNGLEHIQDWPLIVRNAIGEGVVVVETYDGHNTDISHIMSPLVTPDYTDEKIRFKIYSSVNNTTLEGLVNNMVYTRFAGNNILLGGTSNSMFSIKTLDYSLDKKDEAFFYASQPSYGPSYIGGVVQNDVFVRDNRLYAGWLEISKFGLPQSNTFKIPNTIALNARYDYPNIVLSFYSEDLGKFIYQPSLASFGDRVMRAVPSAASPFDPSNITNKQNIAAGVNTNGDFIHLLKDRATQKFGIYILDGGGYDSDDYVVIPSKPKQFVDLSNAPEIDQAISFVILDNQQVLLYATKTKIYGVVYSTSTPIFGVRYAVASGEDITSLRAYYQADYPKQSRNYFARNGKQLILSTYNGAEGKVHILPLINEGVANIDQTNIKTYGGFGKILLTTTQL